MHKIWMVVDPRRALFLAMIGVDGNAPEIHHDLLSSPRYSDHLGFCTTAPTFTPGQPIGR